MSRILLCRRICLWFAVMHLTLSFGDAWVAIRQQLGGLSSLRTVLPKKTNAVLLLSSDNRDKQAAFDGEGEGTPTDELPGGSITTPASGKIIPDNGEQQQVQLQQQSQQREQMSSRDIMNALGTSPRRIVLALLSSSAIALGGNFLGVTSWVETLFPEEAVEATGLDTYFPRGDYKRCKGYGYTFVIPKNWVADTFVALAKAQRQTQPLDYQMKRNNRDGASTTLPDSAYGPPGRLNQRGVSEQGDTNVSVIVTRLTPGFSLKRSLGSPQTAAETLLRVSLAPEGSGRKATLVYAVEDTARDVYQFLYTIDRGERGPPLQAISVIAAGNGDTLYTQTVVAPFKDWQQSEEYSAQLNKIATSFHLITR